MNRHSLSFIGIVLMLCFGIFFGIELATRGMERVHGPIPGPYGYPGYSASNPASTAPVQPLGGNAPAAAPPQSEPQPAATAPAASPVPPVKPQPIVSDSGINRVGNQIGDLLQAAAQGTIRTVVTLLDQLVN